MVWLTDVSKAMQLGSSSESQTFLTPLPDRSSQWVSLLWHTLKTLPVLLGVEGSQSRLLGSIHCPDKEESFMKSSKIRIFSQ